MNEGIEGGWVWLEIIPLRSVNSFLKLGWHVLMWRLAAARQCPIFCQKLEGGEGQLPPMPPPLTHLPLFCHSVFLIYLKYRYSLTSQVRILSENLLELIPKPPGYSDQNSWSRCFCLVTWNSEQTVLVHCKLVTYALYFYKSKMILYGP